MTTTKQNARRRSRAQIRNCERKSQAGRGWSVVSGMGESVPNINKVEHYIYHGQAIAPTSEARIVALLLHPIRCWKWHSCFLGMFGRTLDYSVRQNRDSLCHGRHYWNLERSNNLNSLLTPNVNPVRGSFLVKPAIAARSQTSPPALICTPNLP